jgi:hypothetical protein
MALLRIEDKDALKLGIALGSADACPSGRVFARQPRAERTVTEVFSAQTRQMAGSFTCKHRSNQPGNRRTIV